MAVELPMKVAAILRPLCEISSDCNNYQIWLLDVGVYDLSEMGFVVSGITDQILQLNELLMLMVMMVTMVMMVVVVVRNLGGMSQTAVLTLLGIHSTK